MNRHTLRFFLFDRDAEELYPVAVHSFVEEVQLDDLDAHPEAFRMPGTPKVEESFVGVPLVFRDDLVGVLTLTMWGIAQFSSESLALLEVLGVSIAAGDGRLVLDVVDEGSGIPADDLETIFQRFTQRDPSLRREQGGTGIGLTLARSIARWHVGDLVALPGERTTFRLTLPRGQSLEV